MTDANSAVIKARDYYDSGDADNFYSHVWGGEDIHIGLYQKSDDEISEASRRTVQKMAAQIEHLQPGAKVLDIGSGYGGSARYLAREKGLHVTCLNLSTVQNERNRQITEEQVLSTLVDVVDGSFEALPFDDESYDLVWSQDAILHSGDRLKVFQEVSRVLKPEGEFVFTDPMQVEPADEVMLKPVLERICLESMGSVGVYREYARSLNWEEVAFIELSEQLANHYGRVKQVLESREAELSEFCSEEYRQRMKAGLDLWVEAGEAGALAWGIFHFRKP